MLEKVSNSTRTTWFPDESMVVVLNRPRNPPAEFGGISLPTGARKKARPAEYSELALPWVSMMKEK